MAVRIRLKRFGTKNKPFWRVVVTDGRMPRDGRFIEEVGFYDPKTNPISFELKTERVEHWISCGAQPTEIVKNLLKRKGVKASSKK